jgi:inhibitor of cysteine peptidase
MKKIIFIVVIMILCVGILVGCESSKDNTDKVFQIQLDGNPTTGYEWDYSMDKEGIVKEVSAEYVQDSADEDIEGAGGTYIFEFSGVEEGDVTLTFEYARPWEEVEPPQTVIYKLHVGGSGNITQK